MLTIGRAATIALTLFLASSTWAQQAKDDAGQESTKGAAAKLRDMVNEFQKLARSGDADKAAAYYRENRDQLPADRVISSLVRVCMTYADKEVAYEWMRECVASIAETSPESTAMSIAPRYFLQVGTRCEKELEAYGALVALRKQCATEGDALPSRVDDSFLQALAAGAPEDKQPGHALELTERRKQLVKALAEADAEQAGALGARLATIAPAEARAADKPDLLGEAAAALKKALDKHSDAPNLGFAYMQTMMSYANAMVRTDIAKADKLVAELEATVKDAPEYARYERSVASIRRRLGAAQKHADLIGAQAPAIENVDWANGDPLTAADLTGKVVLVDFWAVWCGPCIATFPHLREWKDEFGPQGLEIVGVTRYYGFDWDDQAERIKKVADLSPEDERAAMARFAEHHELKHVFAVAGETAKLHDQFGVTGIPQAVLIDRQGKVRMIRVGSGEQNAKELHDKIKELIEQ